MKSMLAAWLCMLSLAPLAVAAQTLPSAPYVQVVGHGSLTVVPDMAQITVTVARTDQDLAAARTQVENRATAVLAAARKLGVAERDLSAAMISIWPEYQWQSNSQVFMGEHVSRRIEITLRNLKNYAALITGLVKAGVTTFSTTLERSDLTVLRRQTLAAAVEDAHARAVTLTRAAGATLGPVYSISERDTLPRPQPLMMAAKAVPAVGSSADYEPGTLEINVTVNVVYLLRDAQ